MSQLAEIGDGLIRLLAMGTVFAVVFLAPGWVLAARLEQLEIRDWNVLLLGLSLLFRLLPGTLRNTISSPNPQANGSKAEKP